MTPNSISMLFSNRHCCYEVHVMVMVIPMSIPIELTLFVGTRTIGVSATFAYDAFVEICYRFSAISITELVVDCVNINYLVTRCLNITAVVTADDPPITATSFVVINLIIIITTVSITRTRAAT